MKKRVLEILPIFVVILFASAAWLLYQDLQQYHLRDLHRSLSEIPSSRVMLALVLTGVSYAILGLYDLLAVRFIKHPLPVAKVALSSFISYVSSNNFGHLLGGPSVRYRLYSAWGLSVLEIAELIALLSLTFWLGIFSLAGVLFFVEPLAIPARLYLPFSSTQPFGVVLLSIVAIYFMYSLFRKQPLTLGWWKVTVPPLRMSLAQVVVASGDLLVSATILYVLASANVGVGGFLPFASVYLLAVVSGVISHVPGGLGVFEAVMLLFLQPAEPQQFFGALLAYRAIYYLLPLGVAAVVMGVVELLRYRTVLHRVGETAGRLAGVVMPPVFAYLTLLAGAVILISGAIPRVPERLSWLMRLSPLSVVEVSHFFGSLAGAGLLVLAHGLQRRYDSAYWLVVALLTAGIVLTLLRGLDYEEALILCVMLFSLLPARRQFYRRGSLLAEPLSLGWAVNILLVLGSSLWLGFFAHKHVDYATELWWQFSFRGDAPRFLRSSVGAASLIFVLAIARLLRPAQTRPTPHDDSQLDLAARIVAAAPETYAHLALLGDKRFIFNAERTAFLMYGAKGRSFVALGGPVGPPAAHQNLVWRFREVCDSYDGWCAFYRVDGDHLSLYVDSGLTCLKLGEEAQVPLHGFSLEGKARKSLRHTYRHLKLMQCTFDLVPATQVPSLLRDFKRISNAWLAEKHTREKGFALGYFDAAYIKRCPAAIVRHNGAIVAFANVWCGADRHELSIDLMRHAPGAPPSVMEFLILCLMLWGAEQGYEWFNLGMAPLSGLESGPLATLWSQVGTLIFRHGEHFYNFQGLRQYKEKFNPQWRAKYLVAPGGYALPKILADITTLISGGIGGLFGK